MLCAVAIPGAASGPRNARPENPLKKDFNVVKECFMAGVAFVLGVRRGLCCLFHAMAVSEKESVET